MYSYMVQRTQLDSIRLQKRLPAQMSDGRIYYCHPELVGSDLLNDDENDEFSDTYWVTVVSSITVNGEDFRQIELADSDIMTVLDFSILNDSVIEILATKIILSESGISLHLVHREYDFYGKEINQNDYTHLLPANVDTRDILQAMVVDKDNIAVLLEGERNNSLFILNAGTGSVFELQLTSQHFNSSSMVALKDGRLLVLDAQRDHSTGEVTTIFREVDFLNEDFAGVYPVSGNISLALHPARFDASYDFLISSNSTLYSYTITTGEQMKLLDWVETGIIHHNSENMFIGAYNDSTLCVLLRSSGVIGQEIMLFTLTQVPRGEMPEQIVITLGGFMIPDEITNMVIDFNQQNISYRVDIVDYFELSGGNRYGYIDPAVIQAAWERLRIDVVTGRGPDILIDTDNWSATGVFLDLYPFIDADRELDRSDFIPNVLESLERPDGRLPVIATDFSVSVIIGTKEAVGHIDLWTPSALLSLAEESLHMDNPFDVQLTSEMFIMNQLYFGTEYYDLENFKANIDSAAFISLLETSKYFPHERVGIRDSATMERYIKLLQGECLLLFEHLGNIEDFLFLTQVIGEDMVILGKPTENGGKHFLNIRNKIGINASTQYADAAWEFLRTLLLKTADITDYFDSTQGFPIRTDRFEDIVTGAATPRYAINTDGSIWTDDDGNPVELPYSTRVITASAVNYVGSNRFFQEEYNLYAMPDTAADSFRAIVYSSIPNRNHIDATLIEMIHIDLARFFEGARTAEDTARIMQSRVQIFLSEQELLAP